MCIRDRAREIPYIAANLQNLVLPRQNQVWAVLRKDHTKERLEYGVAAGFLGRLCLSGDIEQLSEEQWQTISDGIKFYQGLEQLSLIHIWLDWTDLEKHADIYRYFTNMIALRKAHPILRDQSRAAACGFPLTSFHGTSPWELKNSEEERVLGCLLYTSRCVEEKGRCGMLQE